MDKVLVTGCSGFIGMHLCEDLLKDGYKVIGIDNMNDYYSIKLKEFRLGILKKYDKFVFEKANIEDWKLLKHIFFKNQPNVVVNLAAQAGVRHSLKDPHVYIQSNVVGFMNILELCRINKVKNLVYASSSSVYGDSEKDNFIESQIVDKPISIYASTKRSNELMAYSYNHLYDINTTGLRFFTAYGPMGRPDMVMYIFTKNILDNKPINIFNNGDMKRDFTYIDDIVKGVRLSMNNMFGCEIFNLGSGKTTNLKSLIKIIECKLNKKAKINLMPIQPGDVKNTLADISHSTKLLHFNPKTKIEEGVGKFIDWYLKYKRL